MSAPHGQKQPEEEDLEHGQHGESCFSMTGPLDPEL